MLVRNYADPDVDIIVAKVLRRCLRADDGSIRRYVEALIRKRRGRGRPRKDAESFLRNLLTDGPLQAKEVLVRAQGAGLSERTMRAAKQTLAITSVRVNRAWTWQLPV